MKRAILVSLKFNPGHLSHLLANKELLSEGGYNVKFLCSHQFFEFAGLDASFQRTTVWESLSLCVDDLFIVWFPSISAVLQLILVRLLTRATVVYIFHEPFTSFRSFRDGGFGMIKLMRVGLVSIVNLWLVLLSHKVVVPSGAAMRAFKDRYSDKKPCAIVNLMFRDEAPPALPLEERRSVSYVGTIAEDHAFLDFARFVHWAVMSNRLAEFNFMIATRSAIPEEVREMLEECVLTGRLEVQSGRPLTNEEINGCFNRSMVVWNAYKRSMQSGILPKAYMCGCPVLISDRNPSEYFIDRVTGVAISSNYEAEEIAAAVQDVSANFSKYSENCRAMFLRSFDYRALARPFIDFVSRGKQ